MGQSPSGVGLSRGAACLDFCPSGAARWVFQEVVHPCSPTSPGASGLCLGCPPPGGRAPSSDSHARRRTHGALSVVSGKRDARPRPPPPTQRRAVPGRRTSFEEKTLRGIHSLSHRPSSVQRPGSLRAEVALSPPPPAPWLSSEERKCHSFFCVLLLFLSVLSAPGQARSALRGPLPPPLPLLLPSPPFLPRRTCSPPGRIRPPRREEGGPRGRHTGA